MKMVIQDTADVYFKRKSDGHTVFTTEAQLASLSGAISEEKLYAGIGNKPIYILKTQKNLHSLLGMLCLILNSWRCHKVKVCKKM